MFSCSCSCLSFISTNSIRGPQPPGTAAQGSHLSFCPYISRQRPLLGGLHGGLGTFGSLSLSLSCSPNLGLDLSPGLGLELAQLETLGYMGYRGMNLLPKLGMGMLAKSAEFVAAALWDLGLDLLGLYETLIAQQVRSRPWSCWSASFSGPSCASWQSERSSGTWAPPPLRDLHLCDQGFWMPLCAIFRTGCAWCVSRTWPDLHPRPRLQKCLGTGTEGMFSCYKHSG